jgi:hypothetical protein
LFARCAHRVAGCKPPAFGCLAASEKIRLTLSIRPAQARYKMGLSSIVELSFE